MGTQSTWGITTSTINPNQQLNQQHVSHLNHCPCSDLRSRSISRPRDGSPRSPPRTPPPRHLRTWRRLLWLRTGPLQIPRTELRPSRDEQRYGNHFAYGQHNYHPATYGYGHAGYAHPSATYIHQHHRPSYPVYHHAPAYGYHHQTNGYLS